MTLYLCFRRHAMSNTGTYITRDGEFSFLMGPLGSDREEGAATSDTRRLPCHIQLNASQHMALVAGARVEEVNTLSRRCASCWGVTWTLFLATVSLPFTSFYLDDSVVVAASEDQAKYRLEVVLDTLEYIVAEQSGAFEDFSESEEED